MLRHAPQQFIGVGLKAGEEIRYHRLTLPKFGDAGNRLQDCW
jgi:hypothetical protein